MYQFHYPQELIGTECGDRRLIASTSWSLTHTQGLRVALLLSNQQFNAQAGIAGHELVHSFYCLDCSLTGIKVDAICQLNGCRVDFEKDTDI